MIGRRARWLSLLIAVGVALTAMVGFSPGTSAADDLTLDDIRAAWRRVNDFPWVGEWEFTESRTQHNAGSLTDSRSWHYRIVSGGDKVIQFRQTQQENAPLEVLGENDSYGFELRQSDSSAPFVLSGIYDLSNANEPAAVTFREQAKHVRRIPWNSLYMTVRWTNLFDSPDLSVSKIEPIEWQGVPAVEVRFSYDAKSASDDSRRGAFPYQHADYMEIRDARVVVRPDMACMPVFWSLSIRNPDMETEFAIHETEAEYDATSWEVPVLIRRTTRIVQGTLELNEQLTYRYDLGRRLASSEFRLTAFGLPEPGWSRRDVPWLLYGLVAAVVLIVAGGLLLRWARR